MLKPEIPYAAYYSKPPLVPHLLEENFPHMNVKFSKGHLATLKHKSKDIEKSMSRMKK